MGNVLLIKQTISYLHSSWTQTILAVNESNKWLLAYISSNTSYWMTKMTPIDEVWHTDQTDVCYLMVNLFGIAKIG